MSPNMRIAQRHGRRKKALGKDHNNSHDKAIQLSFKISQLLPALVISAILGIFVMSTIEPVAGLLPLVRLLALALSGFEALLALFAPRSSTSRWEIAAAFALVSAVAASLSEARHIFTVFGLTMVH